MARAIHKTTKHYKKSADPNKLDSNWIINPSFPEGTPTKYVKIVGNDAIEMSQSEKDQADYDIAAQLVRSTRDERLADSDWTQMVDCSQYTDTTARTEWQAYRQSLRDVTAQAGFPFNIIWPEEP